jgi:acetoin utilization deacetylase AcuC-like enzyme
MRVTTIWDDRYHCVASGRLLSTRKQRAVVEAALAEELIAVADSPGFNADVVWADIATVHAPAYVSAVRTGKPRRLAKSQGFDWSPEFADSVVRIWHGQQVAARLALTEGVVLHPVSGAHHAGYAAGGGFCTFHHIVGGGRALMREGLVRRVAVLDLDAHYGNGTADLTENDQRFGLFDISSWGGAREAQGFRIFLGAQDVEEYFTGLRELPAFLDGFRPDLVFYQAGLDCFEGDYMGAVEGMTAERLAERDRVVLREVMSRGIPVVINLAGGYVQGITEILHVNTIRIACEFV